MDEGELRFAFDLAEAKLDSRASAGFFGLPTGAPPPAHDDSLGPADIEKLARTFMLQVVAGAETHAEEAAHPHVRFGTDNRQIVGSPPRCDALGCRQSLEDD